MLTSSERHILSRYFAHTTARDAGSVRQSPRPERGGKQEEQEGLGWFRQAAKLICIGSLVPFSMNR